MPELQLHNGSGQTVVLLSQGLPVLKLQAGYSGPVTLSGQITVNTVAVTNITQIPTGQCVVNYNTTLNGELLSQTQFDPPVWRSWGEVIDFQTIWGPHQSPPVPTVGSARLSMVIEADETATNIQSAWIDQGPNQGAITNILGGGTLGTFDADANLRAVQIQVQDLTTLTHADGLGWAVAGFLLGVTVETFRFVMRTIRALHNHNEM